ncbi:MAG TPA: hypothetical protein VG122_10310 [Gemmata sp.]|nr:hypothetical protein [Gemmata sp.]
MKRQWRELIAVMEIAGGISGLLGVIYQLILHRRDPASLNLVWLLIDIYLLALFAGFMLWRDTRVGRVASIVSQLIQLPKLLSPEFTFMVSYGFDFYWMSLTRPGRREWHFNFQLLSYNLPIINTELWREGFGVSFVSLLALRLLLRGNRVEEKSPRKPEPTNAASTSGASTHPEWVRPAWMVVLGILVAILLTTCVGLSILSSLFSG